MDDLIYSLTVILVAVGLIAVAIMFLAAGILFWRQLSETLKERRDIDDEIKRLEKRRLPSPV